MRSAFINSLAWLRRAQFDYCGEWGVGCRKARLQPRPTASARDAAVGESRSPSTAPLPYLALALLLALALPLVASAQETQAEVEARLRSLRAQVSEDARALAAGEREAASLVDALGALAREQATREALAQTLRRRIGLLHAESARLRTKIATLEADYTRQQADYRERLVHVYKYGRTDRLALILSAKSPAQMLVRARYLQRFADQRTANLDRLRATADALQAERATLATTQRQAQTSLEETEAEEARLQALASQRTNLLARLRGEQSTLQAAIAQKRAEVSALEQRVAALIAEARRRREAERRAAEEREAAAREAAARAQREAAARSAETEPSASPPAARPPEPPAARPTPPTRDPTPNAPSGAPRSAPTSDASYRALSRAFAQNKGRLPWPVQGAVAERFGTTTNPTYGTRTPSLGIVIATGNAAPVRAVFGGEVVGVDAVLGFGTLVMIEHGDYQSVYSNFSTVTVRPGQRVAAGETIGRAGTAAEPKGRSLFFAVFKSGAAQNPLSWLRSR